MLKEEGAAAWSGSWRVGEGLTFSSLIWAWDRSVTEGAELLESGWTVRGQGGEGQGPSAALRRENGEKREQTGWGGGTGLGEGRDWTGAALTTALLRTQLTGVVPALAGPLAATAPGLGGVESFGHRAPSGLETGEAETLPCVCGVIPQRIAGRAISSAHPPYTSSTPVPTNGWACLYQQPIRTLQAMVVGLGVDM